MPSIKLKGIVTRHTRVKSRTYYGSNVMSKIYKLLQHLDFGFVPLATIGST